MARRKKRKKIKRFSQQEVKSIMKAHKAGISARRIAKAYDTSHPAILYVIKTNHAKV